VAFTNPSVTVTGTTTSGSDGGKSGGGGLIDPLAVSLLGLLTYRRMRRRQ
jgi:hypothetical protein